MRAAILRGQIINPTARRYLLILVITSVASAHAQWIGDAEAEAHISTGIGHIYNLAFDSARHEFRQVVRSHPDHPAGHFFLATVEWWNILIDIDNTSYDDKFLSLIDKVIDLCDEHLDKNENDVAALFFKGGALGFRGRLHGNRSDWMKAANDGREALPIVQRAYKLAPNNHDILLGIGIYNYYAAIIPEHYPIVKPLMIFFPSGDRQKGLVQLRQASEHARYAGVEATYFMMQVLQNYERQPGEALPLALKLSKRFPKNAIFQRCLGRCHAALGQWDEMVKVFSEVLHHVNDRQPGYNTVAEREAEYYLGQFDMEQGRYDAALGHLYRCDELSRALDKVEQSGFMVVCNLRIGMIYDLQSKRDQAMRQYGKVLKMNEYMNAHQQAEQYLKSPYKKS